MRRNCVTNLPQSITWVLYAGVHYREVFNFCSETIAMITKVHSTLCSRLCCMKLYADQHHSSVIKNCYHFDNYFEITSDKAFCTVFSLDEHQSSPTRLHLRGMVNSYSFIFMSSEMNACSILSFARFDLSSHSYFQLQDKLHCILPYSVCIYIQSAVLTK